MPHNEKQTMETKFYRCEVCGNVVTKLHDSGVGPYCCSRAMEELKPNTEEAAVEKHLPVAIAKDGTHFEVKVGSEPHPMTEQHHIMFLYLETKDKEGHQGGHFVLIGKDKEAKYDFVACSEDVVSVYAYCNLHGLWKQTFRKESK